MYISPTCVPSIQMDNIKPKMRMEVRRPARAAHLLSRDLSSPTLASLNASLGGNSQSTCLIRSRPNPLCCLAHRYLPHARFLCSPIPLRSPFSASRLTALAPERSLVIVTETKKAVSILNGTSGVEGVVTLVQEDDSPATVSVRVIGLTPGLHGFHLHEFGDTRNGCISTGAHFNPNKTTHGAPNEIRHAADLGNIVASSEGSFGSPFMFTSY